VNVVTDIPDNRSLQFSVTV